MKTSLRYGHRLLLASSLALAFAAQAEESPVEAALRRTHRICREVEAIRGMRFTNAVSTAVQSEADFRAYVRSSLERQLGATALDDYMAALVRLGALEKPVDLMETVLDLMKGQAAAYYDPEKDCYFLLATNLASAALDVVSSHELCHALQDQHYDLYAFMQEDVEAIRDNGDRATARQCLVEGDATLVMTIWMLADQAGQSDPARVESLASMAAMTQAGMDLDTLIDASSGGLLAGGSGGFEGLELSAEDLRQYPRFLIESLLAPYLQGAAMVDAVRRAGGWRAVDGLFTNPPASTEQVLHPEQILGKRDAPVDVRMPELGGVLPEDWRLAEEDVMGELGIRLLLGCWQDEAERDHARIVSAAAGWGGDRYYFHRQDATGAELLVWKTEWDTAADAGEFSVAYRLALDRRFPGLKLFARSQPGSLNPSQTWELAPGRWLKLMKKDRTVGIMDTTDRALLDAVWP